MAVEDQLRALGLELPPAPRPVASYVPAVRSGDLLFLSGVLPMKEGKAQWIGKLGRELTVEQGKDAARLACLNALAVVKSELGSLDAVSRIVRVGGFVASIEGFTEQPVVLNGASDLLVAVFGDAGRHARAVIGAVELPLGVAVEIELVVEVAAARVT